MGLALDHLWPVAASLESFFDLLLARNTINVLLHSPLSILYGFPALFTFLVIYFVRLLLLHVLIMFHCVVFLVCEYSELMRRRRVPSIKALRPSF